MAFAHRVVRAHFNGFRVAGVRHFVERHIFWNVDHHRTRTAAASNVEGLLHDFCHVAGVFDQEIVLHDGARDAHGVALLESIEANGRSGHLTTDDDHGNAVHIGCGNAGHGIGQTWTRCDQGHTDIAGSACIAIGCMDCSLFVANQHVLNGVLFEESVVDVQNGTTWVTPDVFDVFGLERFNEDFATAQFDGGRGSCGSSNVGRIGHFSFGDFHIQPL